MAQFRATIKGSKGVASRLGGKKSGIDVHVNAWDLGIRVVGYYNEKTKQDEFDLYLNAGSNGNGPSFNVGRFVRKDLDRCTDGGNAEKVA